MKLHVIGDAIVADSGEMVAFFNRELLPTLRERAEELLMQGAVESDWELRERLIEQQDQIEEMAKGLHERDEDIELLTNTLADLRCELQELRKLKCLPTK